MFSQNKKITMLRITLLLLLIPTDLWAAPAAEIWPVWQTHAEQAIQTVDHSPWGLILESRVVSGADSINRVQYEEINSTEKAILRKYLTDLQQVTVSELTREQQRAYWINLYNAGTVQVVLDHYPVASILDIDISPGWFSNGPWDKKLFKIEGREVSLNDIEHRILRPIWRDPRIHYALNCASIGCPNLQPVAFTVENTERLLEQAAEAYVSHPRGARVVDGKLVVSSIYHWFMSDFGGNDQGVIQHLRSHADASLSRQLQAVEKISSHQYDWSINAAK